MSRIRWGLLGAGRISGWFATGLSVLPDDAELYAIASRDLNKAQAFAEKFCDEYCKFPFEMEYEALVDKCEQCPMARLIELGGKNV